MDRLDQVAVFLEVARRKSFRAAALSLKISKSGASRAVHLLEERLHVRLLERTTRSVRLTDAGVDYLARVEPAFEALRDGDAVISGRSQRIEGRLRVGAGVTFCEEQIMPLVARFVEENPGLELELVVSDRQVDLITERLDCAVRVAHLRDSSLVARRLANSSHVLCASPAFASKHGPLTQIEQLSNLPLIMDSNQRRAWMLRQGARRIEHVPVGRLTVNSARAVRSAVLAGLGVALCPAFIVGEDLLAGRLVRVLGDFEGPNVPISIVYPSHRFVPPKLRAWVEHLAQAWTSPPPWERWR
jgi:DNA-binding transcriptional LysR family regulator